MLIKNAPISIGEELGQGDTKTLRKRAMEASKAYRKQPLSNAHSGHVLHVGRGGIEHSIADPKHRRRERAEIHAIAKLPEIIHAATHVESREDRANDMHTKAFHRYAANVHVEGEVRQAIVVARETNDGHHVYDHHFLQKKEPGGLMGKTSLSAASPARRGFSTSVLAPIGNTVNKNLAIARVRALACASVATPAVLLSTGTADVLYLSAATSLLRDAVTLGQGLPPKHNDLPVHYRWMDAVIAGN